MTRHRIIVAVVLAAAGLSCIGVAQAHNPNNIYGPEATRWQPNRDRLEYEFDKSVPRGRWRARINDGAREWNRYDRRVHFVPPANPNKSRDARAQFRCPSRQPRASIIFRAPFPDRFGRAIGLNFTCVSNDGEPLYFRQFYDSTFDDFWTDPRGNGRVPDNRIDLQSTAAHEMGHATRWGPHLDDDGPDAGDGLEFRSYCRSYIQADRPDDRYRPEPGDDPFTGKQTMCALISYGQRGQRRLGSHDRGTFRNAYGRR